MSWKMALPMYNASPRLRAGYEELLAALMDHAGLEGVGELVREPALPARLTRYLENVAEGKRRDGTWFVSRLAVSPASSAQGAMCR